jgi:hypothetical protein
MACDRFIYKCEKKPTKKDIGVALVDYLGDDLIKELQWSKDRWFVALRSERSHPLRHLVDPAILFLDQEPDDGRWFEVWIKGKTVDVITRRQDELTNNIALGFAKLVARFWEGELEDR